MWSEFGAYEEQDLGKIYDAKLLRRLFTYARPYARLLTAAVVFVLFLNAVDIALPYLMKIAVDRYIVPEMAATEGGKTAGRDSDRSVFRSRSGDLTHRQIARLRKDDLSGITRISLLFLGIVVIHVGFYFVQITLLEYVGQRVMHDMRRQLFDHVTSRSLSFFTRNPVGRLVTRITNDVQNMQELFTSILVVIFKDALLLSGITFVLIGIDWRLALVSLSVVPFVIFISFRFSAMIRDAFRSLRVLIARINTRFAETVGGISVIQTFLWEDKNEATFAGLNHAFYQAGIRQLTIFALFLPIIEVLGSISIALVVFYGGWRVTGKALSLGELVAFISYLKMFFRPIREIAERYNIMQNAMASAERIFQILDTPDSIPRHANIIPYPSRTDTPDRIRFENITFGYSSDTPVLKSVNFDIPAGSTYAVVGPTGAGKTSLINLLVRFYDPWSGVVRINGTDIRTLALAELRAAVALVPQDPFLFSGTIRDNIFITRPPPGAAETTDILARSRVDTIVNRLPDGLDTPIGEGGAAFSSGERQLISIARAFAKNPRIILLDEATSYIDAESEEKIRQALLALTAERTTIQVAHRISTAKRADAVAVVAGGRIVETGTHAELINSGGLYATLSSTG